MGNQCPKCKKTGIKLDKKKKQFYCSECGALFPAIQKGGFYRMKLPYKRRKT